MNTQAYFENIQDVIKEELSLANKEVFAAVAWFTDVKLFKELLSLCDRGIRVELIINFDHINQESAIDFELLNIKGGKFLYCENSNLMHNKFAVIDSSTVINGSYNWTNRAKYNHETITVIKEAEKYAQDFVSEFQKIKSFIVKENQCELNLGDILLRLDVIKNFILLQDKNSISSQIEELIRLKNNESKEINTIVSELKKALTNNQYSNVSGIIEKFCSDNRSLTTYIDFETEAVKLEINSLKFQISSLENEIYDIERMVSKFQHEYNLNLGKLLIIILKIEKELVKDDSGAYSRASKNYEDFNASYEEERKRIVNELTSDEEKRLKYLFRSASKLCHPDIVQERDKEKAVNAFLELKKAFDDNDLKKVESIHINLKNNGFEDIANSDSTKESLSIELDRLKEIRTSLEKDIIELRNSESYVLITSIGDWSQYFEDKKLDLNNRLAELKAIKNESTKIP